VLAGTGSAGYSGDGGPAVRARLSGPQSVAVDAAGNVYIADTQNARVRLVASDGRISTVAGNGTRRSSGDGRPAVTASLESPTVVAVDAQGRVLIADTGANRVRRIARDGTILTLAGTGSYGASGDNGPATAAQLGTPEGLATDHHGYVYVAQGPLDVVRGLAPDGKVHTVAGTGVAGTLDHNGDGGPATQAPLNQPQALTTDAAGDLFIAEIFPERVRRVTAAGTISTVLGGTPGACSPIRFPAGLAVDSSGALYVSDRERGQILRLDPSGTVTYLTGLSRLQTPDGLALDEHGHLYVADDHANRVWRVTLSN